MEAYGQYYKEPAADRQAVQQRKSEIDGAERVQFDCRDCGHSSPEAFSPCPKCFGTSIERIAHRVNAVAKATYTVCEKGLSNYCTEDDLWMDKQQ